ncbi:MAG: RnfH family protein [Methylococcaceae bacterium]
MIELGVNAEVAYAVSGKQVVIDVQLVNGASVQQAINESGILILCPEIDQAEMNVGVFGKACGLEKIIEQGDRVEIYRPLLQNPMDARRNRAIKK